MAGVPARPKTFFRISPAEPGEAQCFAVRRGEIPGRADAVFHRPWVHDRLALLERSNFTVTRLGTVAAEISHGISSPPPYLDKSEDTVPFIRATDIKDGEVNFDTLFHISKDQPNHFAKCRLSGGELIIVRSGVNTGDCAVVPELLADSFAAYDLILKFRPDISPKFVAAFLDTEIGRLQLNLVKGRSAQPHINTGEVAAVQILLPPIEFQNELVTAMDAARAERKVRLAEADALLAGMDDFVLDTLGLASPQADSRRVFAISPANLHGQVRLNSEYYHPERIAVLRSLDMAASGLNIAPLAQIVSFVREQLKAPTGTYLGLAHIQSHTGELTDSADTSSGNCFAYETGDVLFSRLRPYLNKVHRAETSGSCSTEFHVLRIADTDGILPDYLAAILRSKVVLAQTVHMATGNTHPRLTNEDVANLKIPVPDPEIQQIIAAEINRRRQEARRLRSEAENLWHDAKQWFEGELLGGVTQ